MGKWSNTKMNSFWKKSNFLSCFQSFAQVLTENFLGSHHLVQKADFEFNEKFQQISAVYIKEGNFFFYPMTKDNTFL